MFRGRNKILLSTARYRVQISLFILYTHPGIPLPPNPGYIKLYHQFIVPTVLNYRSTAKFIGHTEKGLLNVTASVICLTLPK